MTRNSCRCGAVEMALRGSPAARAYCHCASCRDFYGLAVLAATAWQRDAVRVVKGSEGLGEYQHPAKQMRRYFCRSCGETLFGSNRLGLTVVPNAFVARATGGALAVELSPQFHLFYAQRVLDVDDELPKYLEGRDGPLFAKRPSPAD